VIVTQRLQRFSSIQDFLEGSALTRWSVGRRKTKGPIYVRTVSAPILVLDTKTSPYDRDRGLQVPIFLLQFGFFYG
jgi:hypothetical protein